MPLDFLSRAIIVYKEYGRVYQIVGTPDAKDLTVYPLSSTGYCSGATISIDDRSYYLGNQGFMSFMLLIPMQKYNRLKLA